MAEVAHDEKDFDHSYGHTDEKEFSNMMAITGNGQIKGIIVHEESAVNIASLIDAAGATAAITVNGVALGDIVLGVSFGVDLVDMTVTAYVQAANAVEVRVQNESGATADLASTTVKLIIAKMS